MKVRVLFYRLRHQPPYCEANQQLFTIIQVFTTAKVHYSKTPFKDHPEIKTTPLLRPPF